MAALKQQGKTISQVTHFYFSTAQKRFKTPEQLTAVFVNDCFTILDHYKISNENIEKFYERNELSTQEKFTAKVVYDVCSYINDNLAKFGKRDFSDQIVDCLKLFKNPKFIPLFDHVLVDEYQDVNKIQIELIDVINPKNLFCVGDPRQSIFGWRGSRIQYIVNYKEKYPDCEIITLINNYRSSESIVELMNKTIKNMELPDLKSNLDADKDISLYDFSNEKDEHSFIVNQVSKSKIPRNEIFILARTNKTLLKLSDRLRMYDIPHLLRTDDLKKAILDKSNAITLATVHAIKGLEAEKVYVVGCNSRNFPCRSSDHPILDLIKLEDYDKHEEELRLFYVAISRAKKSLTMSYSGTVSYFITQEMMKQVAKSENSGDVITKIKTWRTSIAEKEKIAPYFILHDSTVEEIASKKPSTLKELELINGIGPLKIMKFGKSILQLIN